MRTAISSSSSSMPLIEAWPGNAALYSSKRFICNVTDNCFVQFSFFSFTGGCTGPEDMTTFVPGFCYKDGTGTSFKFVFGDDNCPNRAPIFFLETVCLFVFLFFSFGIGIGAQLSKWCMRSTQARIALEQPLPFRDGRKTRVYQTHQRHFRGV